MTISRRGAALRSTIACLFFAAAVSGASPAVSQEQPQGTTQATMRGIFNVLTTTYAYSLDAAAFEDPANREEIQRLLNMLAVNADGLQTHGGGLDASFDYLRRSLAKDAHDALKRFERGQYSGSKFVLQMMIQNCVTCHTKLPAERQFDLGAEFTAQIDAGNLTPAARANLEVAARQFDAALATWEAVLGDPEVTAETIEMYAAFESYLRICLGAMNETGRPARALEAFKTRTDMPPSLQTEVTSWIGSLDTLDLKRAEGEELAAARALIGDADFLSRPRRDRERMVDYIAAACLLHRYLRSGPADKTNVAEAYYLLGVSDAYVSRSYWVSETEYFLDQAIRSAPKSPVAKQALTFLEDYTMSAHRVPLARAAPPEVTANLEELRQLIED